MSTVYSRNSLSSKNQIWLYTAYLYNSFFYTAYGKRWMFDKCTLYLYKMCIIGSSVGGLDEFSDSNKRVSTLILFVSNIINCYNCTNIYNSIRT